MKSIETKFSEAMDALRKVGKQQVFNEKAAKLTTIESKLNCAEGVLKASRVIPKHNGAADNGHDFSAGYVQENHSPFAACDRLIAESLGLNDAQTRQLIGRAPAEIEALGEAAVREFSFRLGIRLTEAQAIASVKKTFSK